jgi:Tat protein translocase TatB subunit
LKWRSGLDFFGVGPAELILIVIIVLIVLGPEKLVSTAKTLGKTVHAFRKAASDLTIQVTKEMEEEKASKFKNEGKDAASFRNDPEEKP